LLLMFMFALFALGQLGTGFAEYMVAWWPTRLNAGRDTTRYG
jgi:hypothetical protein